MCGKTDNNPYQSVQIQCQINRDENSSKTDWFNEVMDGITNKAVDEYARIMTEAKEDIIMATRDAMRVKKIKDDKKIQIIYRDGRCTLL